MMARVNWELMPGETVEEFAAALLLLEHPRGNIITPSRGDRGIDIRIPADGNRFDIYQVKRFTRPLSAKQATNIENSWAEFVEKTLPRLEVRSWTLVTPWNPTNERLEWLEGLTGGTGLDEITWMGRTNLDVRASQNSRLVDYYFGDGRNRTESLMAQALAGAQLLPEAEGENLLAAIGVRQRALAVALDEIDPFYRYVSEIRPGRLGNLEEADVELGALAGTRSEECTVVAREIDDEHLWVLRVYPRCAESFRLRPLSTTVALAAEPGSPEHEALHRFVTYGVAPEMPMPARIIRAEGPPGVTPPLGEALIRIGAASTPQNLGLDLELRIEPSGRVVELINIEQSRGLNGHGVRVVGTDRAGAIEVEFLGNNADNIAELGITPHDVGGQPPRLVLPTLQAMEDLFSGSSSVTLAIAGGPALVSPWDDVDLDAGLHQRSQTWAKLAAALVELQRHTLVPLAMPYSVSSSEYHQIIDAAAIVRGEVVEDVWDGVEVHLTHPEAVTAARSGEGEFAMMVIRPLTIKYDGRTIAIEKRFITHTPTARYADPTVASGVRVGDVVRLVPGSDPHMTRRLFESAAED